MGQIENEHGPSWYDVERLHAEFEARYDRQVTFQCFLSHDKETGRTAWTVYASSHPRNTPATVSVRGGSYGFRGNGGAKTMAAAMLMALHRLDDAMHERKSAAEQRSLF